MMESTLIEKVIVKLKRDIFKFATMGLNVFNLSSVLEFVHMESKGIVKVNIVASFINFKHHDFVWIIHWSFKEH